MATGMDYGELERSHNKLLRLVQGLNETAASLRRDLAAARRESTRHRQAKNKANQRARIARLQARFWKELAERRRVERDEALLKQSRPVGQLARVRAWLASWR
jgi:predicted RNase H-like nuclease (RuvC/YqgF family)